MSTLKDSGWIVQLPDNAPWPRLRPRPGLPSGTQVFPGHRRATWNIFFLSEIFAGDPNGGHSSALAENLFWSQGCFSFKLLENFMFPGFMFGPGIQFFLRCPTMPPTDLDSSSFFPKLQV